MLPIAKSTENSAVMYFFRLRRLLQLFRIFYHNHAIISYNSTLTLRVLFVLRSWRRTGRWRSILFLAVNHIECGSKSRPKSGKIWQISRTWQISLAAGAPFAEPKWSVNHICECWRPYSTSCVGCDGHTSATDSVA